MQINSAFKLFDIRGPYPDAVDERFAFLIGKVLSLWKNPKRVVIAYDSRPSSPSLKEFLIDGFSSAGVEAQNLGLCSVPRFYFSVATTNADLGVMITASHSAATENGFKLVGPSGLPFNEAEVTELKSLLASHLADPIVVEKGRAQEIDTTNSYLKTISDLTEPDTYPDLVCLDFNNSSAKEVIQPAFESKGIKFLEVSNPVPGNPLEQSVRQALSESVVKNNASCGLIWDSDGDRVAFVDQKGALISMSFVLGLLARKAILTSKAKRVVVDVRAGLVVRDLVREAGGQLEVLPAWSQFIKFAMSEDRNICFGGETSGHFVYSDFDMIDDGLLAGLRFLSLVAKPDFDSELLRLRKKYFELPEMNFPSQRGNSALVLNRLADYYRSKGDEVSVKDGVTVFGFDWKINLRQSATEPLLRLNLEAKSASDAQKILDEIDDLLN